ncbi:MAG TPA: hypothetical protein VKB71_07930 [Rhizomicrobium sp.]|nr:hypothetical protein [Rhizomicrobium sp.]
MPGLFLVIALAAGIGAGDTLTDDALVAYASNPYDRKEKLFHHEVLGVHHGVQVVADFPCSDICPDYTTRVIHYTVEPGPDCDKIGGQSRVQVIPVSIAAMPKMFCAPAVLVQKKLF